MILGPGTWYEQVEIGPSEYPPWTGTRQFLEIGPYPTRRVMPFRRPGTRSPVFAPGTRVPGNILTFVLVSVARLQTNAAHRQQSVEYLAKFV